MYVKQLQMVVQVKYLSANGFFVLVYTNFFVKHNNQHFVHPLRASAATPDPILSNDEIRTIFSTIEIIVATNLELLEDLRKRMQAWYANQVIGDVFVKMAAFMKVYTNYVKNFNAALSCIQVFLSLAMIVVVA